MAGEREWVVVGERRPIVGAWQPAFHQDVLFPCGHIQERRFSEAAGEFDWMMRHFRQNDTLCDACNAERNRQRAAAERAAYDAYMATAVQDPVDGQWLQPDHLAYLEERRRQWAADDAALEPRLAEWRQNAARLQQQREQWLRQHPEPELCDLCRQPGEWNNGAGQVLCLRHWDSY